MKLSLRYDRYDGIISRYGCECIGFIDWFNLFLCYKYSIQSTQVKVGNQIESYSEVNPVEKTRGGIKYGPYKRVAPMTYAKLHVHYVNNYPFATFKSAEREIEVSHWGNVAIEEVYDLVHTGAKLIGGFSRADFQKRYVCISQKSF